MSETPESTAETGVVESPTRPRGRFRFQVGIRSLVLLMASIAVWMTYLINRREIAKLDTRIAATLPLAHELNIADPDQFAVVMMEPQWMGDSRWDVYLPPGTYRLCVATREIGGKGLPPITERVPISAGKHRISLDQKENESGWHVTVLWDDSGRLIVDEPKEWFTSGTSSGGGQYSLAKQLLTDQPLILYDCRFQPGNPTVGSPLVPKAGGEGVMLWIERVSGENSLIR